MTETTDGSVTLEGAVVDGKPRDVRIVDGRVHSLHPPGTAPGSDARHHLGGRSLLPAFCDPHVHLDKVLTAQFAPTRAVGLAGAIDAHSRVVELDVNGHEQLVARATSMLERMLLRGVLSLRSHVNVGDGLGLLHLHAMAEARQGFSHLMDIQLFAMVHTPLSGTDGAVNRAFLRQALEESSVDGIGGCPHLDPEPQTALEVLFSAAVEAGLPIDLHTDETTDPSLFTLPLLARRSTEAGWQGRVAASHCVSLGMQHPDVQHETARVLAEAGVAVVVLPQTNLYLNSVGVTMAPARGLAPVSVLAAHGVTVAAGSDNLQDPFNPVGDADPLHTASLMVTAAHQLADDALNQVSTNGRTVMRLPVCGVSPGMVADLVALPAADAAGAIAEGPADRMVFRRGRLVAATAVERHVYR